MLPHISVVIPAHNRPQELLRCLHALEGQSFDGPFEILVVDDSVPALRIPAYPHVRLLHIPPTGHTRARNVGIRHARASLIAFTDDDCIPSRDWLATLLRAFRDPGIAGVEGRTVGAKLHANEHATENLAGGQFPTCNLAFRRQILEMVGGFDEAYGFFREDTDIAFAVLSGGHTISFVPKALVHHPARKTAWRAPLRELGMVKSDIRLWRKFPRLYRIYLGRLGGGGVKISLAVWFLTFWMMVALPTPVALVPLGLLLALKYGTHLRRRLFSRAWAGYIIASWIRDLLYPFAFVHALATVHTGPRAPRKRRTLPRMQRRPRSFRRTRNPQPVYPEPDLPGPVSSKAPNVALLAGG